MGKIFSSSYYSQEMKVAIVHDSLTVFGGAERVLIELLSIYPEADLFTSLVSEDILKKIDFKGKTYFSKLSRFRFIREKASFFKSYFYHYYWNSLDLDDYDLVISSSHSFCANWVNVKNVHVSYIHTPPRFLYERINDQLWLKNKIFSFLFRPYFNYLRFVDKKKVSKIDLLIANSKNVSQRIKNAYNLDSIVLYPPVNLKRNKKIKKADRYLFFSRLVKQKGIYLAVKAFNQLNKELLVVGDGRELKELKNLANKNISFLGFVNDEKLKDIISSAKALIYPSIDEDFGLVPIEVLNQGIPVIAHYSGGPKEVLNNDVAVFFKKYDVAALKKAILKFEKRKFSKNDCQQLARNFSREKFRSNFIKLVKNYVN